MSSEQTKFFSLLDNLAKSHIIQVPNSHGTEYTFKALTTEQLKNIVQTVVDPSTTQSSFHLAIYNAMKENFQGEEDVKQFNTLDKLFYILANRIEAVNPTLFIRGDSNSFIPVDLQNVKTRLIDLVRNEHQKLSDQKINTDNVTVTVGLPSLETERIINQEIYAKIDFNQQETTEVQDTLGKVFLTEIVKWIKEIVIEEEVIDFNKLKATVKIQILEKLPANITEKVIDYIEKTKQSVDSCLIVSDRLLPLNGSLFSVR